MKNRDKPDKKTDISHVPPHLLAEMFVYLKNEDTLPLAAFALLDKHFAETVREINQINLIDLVDLLKNFYQIPEEKLPDIQKVSKDTIKIYCNLLAKYQENFKSTLRDFLDQANNIDAYLSAPDITRLFQHLVNGVEKNVPGFKIIHILLKSVKEFKESDAFKMLTPDAVLIKAVVTKHPEAVLTLLSRKTSINARDKDKNTPIMLAAKQGNVELVNLLLNRKADASLSNKNGETALMQAVKSGHIDSVQVILDRKDSDINALNTKQQSALTLAVQQNAEAMTRVLLSNGANPHLVSEGWSLLSIAVRNNNFPLANLLLSHGLDPNATIPSNVAGQTVLMEAAQQGNRELVETLLAHKADISAKDAAGYTAFMKSGNEHIARLLLETGQINLNERTKDNNTALTAALKTRNVSLANFLLIQHAEPNATDHTGSTALMLATQLHYSQAPFIVSTLIDLGAKINATDADGQTTLMRHLDSPIPSLEVVKTLLDSKADLNMTDAKGETALMHYCKHPVKFSILQTLLEAKADKHAKAPNGLSPFLFLIRNGIDYAGYPFEQSYRPDILKLLANESELQAALLELISGNVYLSDNKCRLAKNLFSIGYKFDINELFKTHPTLNPLSAATYVEDVNMVQFLLEQRADPNATNSNNATALMISMMPKKDQSSLFGQARNVEITKILLQSKADPNIKTKDGKTPLTNAALSGNIDIIKLLLNYHADLSITNQDGLTALEIATKKAKELESKTDDNKSVKNCEAERANQLVTFLEEVRSSNQQSEKVKSSNRQKP